jgi:hypothetical protein
MSHATLPNGLRTSAFHMPFIPALKPNIVMSLVNFPQNSKII